MPRTCNGESSFYALRDYLFYLASTPISLSPALGQFPLFKGGQCSFEQDSGRPVDEPI